MKKDTRKMWLKRMVCYRVAAAASMTRDGVLEDVVFQETSGYGGLGESVQVEGKMAIV